MEDHEQILPLWEVFVQEGTAGAPHEHVGSVRAEGPEMAIQNARDVYARRGTVQSIWVVPASAIIATTPHDVAALFEPAAAKGYRHPQFYSLPKGMKDS